MAPLDSRYLSGDSFFALDVALLSAGAEPSHAHARDRISFAAVKLVQRRVELGKFELGRLQSAALEHTDAVGQGIADGLDAPQRQRVGAVDFKSDELTHEERAFFQRQTVGRAAEGTLEILGSGSGHFRGIVAEAGHKMLRNSASTMNQYAGPACGLIQAR